MSSPVTLLRDRVLDLDPAVQLEEVDVGAVDEELGRAGALGSRSPRRTRRAPRGDPRPGRRVEAGRRATPRSASGGGAGSSSPARRARRRRRRARGAAPRRGEAARGSARRRPCRRRTPPRPRARAAASASSSSAGGADDPHPAAAAAGRGLDDERVADLGGRALRQRSGTPASRAIRFAASLSPPSRSALGRRADPGEPGGDHRLREVARSRPGSRSPGWTASAPAASAARTCSAGSRYERDLDRPAARARVERAAVVAARRRRPSRSRAARRCGRRGAAISPRFATRSVAIATARTLCRGRNGFGGVRSRVRRRCDAPAVHRLLARDLRGG